MRIISTGWAASPGVAGNKFGDVAYLEASYSITAAQSSGSAVYVYAGGYSTTTRNPKTFTYK